MQIGICNLRNIGIRPIDQALPGERKPWSACCRCLEQATVPGAAGRVAGGQSREFGARPKSQLTWINLQRIPVPVGATADDAIPAATAACILNWYAHIRVRARHVGQLSWKCWRPWAVLGRHRRQARLSRGPVVKMVDATAMQMNGTELVTAVLAAPDLPDLHRAGANNGDP